jgi:integrase
MCYDAQRVGFKAILAKANIIAEGDQIVSAYSWRHGAATRWIKTVGYTLARKLMLHSPTTTTLAQFYDHSF